MPRPYWQWVVWARNGCLLVWLAAMLIPLGPWMDWIGWLTLHTLYGLVFMGMLVTWTIWPRVAFSRLRAKLLANEHLLCLSCGYPLKGLPARHTCPECGRPYEAEATRDAWRHWLEHRKLPPDVES
ncbi:MAG TPA: hypothetical protein VM243_09135 [Phycisphaerae bacterium]|nr:hypothetical protein [Phycisphaerae bacterium]